MNKLFIDNESYDIEEDNITISQIKRKIYVNGKLICDIDGDAFTIHGNSVKVKGNVRGSIEANSIEVGGNVHRC